MKKFVYLFELDSVRKTDEEILIGQQALYKEIVGNGNVVVLTYNQFVDSKGFFNLLDIPEYYDNLVKLFEMGAIRISQYGDVRTLSQYLINACSSDRSFIYSGWPLKSTQKRLLALIKRSLIYSDLNEINHYIEKAEEKTEEIAEEIKDLFVEVIENQERGFEKIDTKLTGPQCIEILKKLFHLIKTVLRLSSIHTIYVGPKPDDEYSMTLPKYLHHALSLTPSEKIDNQLWAEAVSILKSDSSVFCFEEMTGSAERSDYHHAIMKRYEEAVRSGKAEDKMPYRYAEAIVDLCYNYQLEYSICNSSKHYNINEFLNDDSSEWKTFSADFFTRLKQDWNTGDPSSCYFLAETNRFEKFEPSELFPDFNRAVRLLGNAKKSNQSTESDNTEPIRRYEYQLEEQKKDRRDGFIRAIRRKAFYSFVCFAIALAFEVILQVLQNLLDEGLSKCIDVNSWWWTLIRLAIEVLVMLVLTEIITAEMAKKVPDFLKLSDALREMGLLRKERKEVCTLYESGCQTHTNLLLDDVEKTQPHMKGEHIDVVESPSIKQYLKLRNTSPLLFQQPDAVPCQLVDIPADNNKAERKSLVRKLQNLEEMYGYRFGVVYKSRYNTMIVDPIKVVSSGQGDNKEPTFSTYERVVPSSGKDGVVMIPVYKGKFILIRQFRHAIRSEQYSFPRGFAEKVDKDSAESAIRELKEELGAQVSKEPRFLNCVTPDSGLASTQASVFLVEIDAYDPKIGHEGIEGSIELTAEDMNKGIEDGDINDGFTLSAWAMWNVQCNKI